MDELTPEARRLLMAARADAEPTEADRRRVYAKVATAIAIGAGATTATSTASATSKTAAWLAQATWLKVGAMAVAVAVGGGVAWQSWPSTRESQPAHNRATTAPRGGEVTPSPQPADIAPASITPSAENVPTLDARSNNRKRTRPSASPMRSAAVAEEVAWISRAEQALEQHQPASALALLKEHATRFPQGELRQERLGLRVIALCMNGHEHSRAEARTFLLHHPGSVLAQRVRSSCLDAKTEP